MTQAEKRHVRTRVLLAIGVAIAAFVILFVLIPTIRIPGALLNETELAIVVDLVGSAVATFVFWAGYALVGHKIRTWEDRIGRKPCDACDKGRVPCKQCEGSGTRTIEVVEQAPCSTCKGTAIVLAKCDRCGGAGLVTRTARYSHALGPPIVRMDYNPLHWGHYEDVSVTVTNTDETSATFQVVVGVLGGTPGNQYASVTLPPAQSATPTFTFKVHGGALRPVQAAVHPEAVRVRCDACGGSGQSNVECPECHGKGTVSVTRKVMEPCPKCEGEKSVKCPKCSGSGRIPRIE